jgi:hypothetical protein
LNVIISYDVTKVICMLSTDVAVVFIKFALTFPFI